MDESTRNRYERLFKSKGENVVVGVEHSACGGCHMKLPAQIVTSCRGAGGNRDLPELRPDFVFHPRHDFDAGRLAVTHAGGGGCQPSKQFQFVPGLTGKGDKSASSHEQICYS